MRHFSKKGREIMIYFTEKGRGMVAYILCTSRKTEFSQFQPILKVKSRQSLK